MADMKSMKIEYPLRDVTFSENSSDFRPNGDLPEYPYGLRLCLDNDTLKKLGILKVPPVGSKMKLEAMVEVCSTSSYDTKEKGIINSMDLQICEMSLTGGKKAVDPNKMYNSEEVKPEVEIEVEQGS